MFNFGLLIILLFCFIGLSILSATALLAVAIPLKRGLEYIFVKKFPWRRKAYIVALSALILTAIGTYVARLFIVIGERLRLVGLDPFPGDIEILLMATSVNTLFVLIAVCVAAFRLRKLFCVTDELDTRRNFEIISMLVVLSLFNFTQTIFTYYQMD